MNLEQKICYISSLHRMLNIPIIYKCKSVKYDFHPFHLDSSEADWDFISQRLSHVFTNYSDSNTLYFIHKSLIMFGMIVNRETDEFVFIGPLASTFTSEKDIADYLFLADLSESATRTITSYMKSNKTFTLQKLQELIININLIINNEIATEETLVSIFDREKETKARLAERLYSEEDDRIEKVNLDELNSFTNRLNYCIIHGDTETLKELLLQLGHIPYPEQNLHSLQDVRTSAIGSLFVAHGVAQKSNVDLYELNRVKQYYLMQVSACQQADEINRIVISALTEFTQLVKKNKKYTTQNPTINKVIKYIQGNITSKLLAADIAEALHISLNYLFTKFKGETGKTLVQYINEEKVKRAIFYLTFTEKPLIEISNHLSFSSQSYFQTVFKNVTGQTPAAYRESNHI